jgi:alkylation response protein AidB-like acyl-CoA dehydrogenase
MALAIANTPAARAGHRPTHHCPVSQAIGSFQTITHGLAGLATELEAVHLMVYDLAEQVDAEPGLLRPREASMAKLEATEVAKRVSLEGMQMMGGQLATSQPRQQRARDAKLLTESGSHKLLITDRDGNCSGVRIGLGQFRPRPPRPTPTYALPIPMAANS